MKQLTIGELTFDRVSYDQDKDILYLHVGEPQAAADSEETPEGHVIRFDDEGRVIGVTMISPRSLLERDGTITLTLPQERRLDAGELAAVMNGT